MKTDRQPILAIVSPCFNEEQVLPYSLPKYLQLISDMVAIHGCSDKSFVVLIDDGSSDRTWEIISDASLKNKGVIRGVKLSRNAGHQYALIAGLDYVRGKCDAAITIDADLQDDLNALPLMLGEYRNGAEIVLGVKASRAGDSNFKVLTAMIFNKGMRLMGVDLVENHADCRLMSSKVLDNLSKFPEYVLFLRGLQPLLHNRIAQVHYHLRDREAGQSKYPLRKMLNLAINGITSFSIAPLRFISLTGLFVFMVSFVFALYASIKAIQGESIPGWASITVPLYLLGGMIVFSIGLVGEYVGKIYLEVKNRPRYLIEEVLDGF